MVESCQWGCNLRDIRDLNYSNDDKLVRKNTEFAVGEVKCGRVRIEGQSKSYIFRSMFFGVKVAHAT